MRLGVLLHMRYLLLPHGDSKKVTIRDLEEQVDHFVLKSHVNVVTAWWDEARTAGVGDEVKP